MVCARKLQASVIRENGTRKRVTEVSAGDGQQLSGHQEEGSACREGTLDSKQGIDTIQSVF